MSVSIMKGKAHLFTFILQQALELPSHFDLSRIRIGGIGDETIWMEWNPWLNEDTSTNNTQISDDR